MKNKFIDIHENEIKAYRDEYYKNIVFYSDASYTYPVVTFLLPLIIILFYLINSDLGICSYLIAVLLLIALNILICILVTSKKKRNKYLDIIRKYGYKSIDDYEILVKKYITGPDAYYHTLLLDYIEKYNLSSGTDRIVTTRNDEYYIWMNSLNDKLYLLCTHSNVKPEIVTINMDDIRYYRHNIIKSMVVLKSKDDIYCFKEKYFELLDKLIPNKKYKSRKDVDLHEYISDYESSLRRFNRELNARYDNRKLKFERYLRKFIYLLITLFVLVTLTWVVPSLSGIIHILNYIVIIELNLSIVKVLSHVPLDKKTIEHEMISLLRREVCYKDMFYELRNILDISDDYQLIYDEDDMEFVIWVSNGYFHLFLNEMVYNCVYMSVKVKDVSYRTKDSGLISLKLKNKNYIFKDSAIRSLKEIISDNHHKR